MTEIYILLDRCRQIAISKLSYRAFNQSGADYGHPASFQNADLLTAFNRRLMEFRGMPEHLALVAKFGGRGPNCRTARQRKPAGGSRRFEVIYCPRYPIPLLAAGT